MLGCAREYACGELSRANSDNGERSVNFRHFSGCFSAFSGSAAGSRPFALSGRAYFLVFGCGDSLRVWLSDNASFQPDSAGLRESDSALASISRGDRAVRAGLSADFIVSVVGCFGLFGSFSVFGNFGTIARAFDLRFTLYWAHRRAFSCYTAWR